MNKRFFSVILSMLAVLTVSMIIIAGVSVSASAADFNLLTKRTLPIGTAYEEYHAHILMEGGNDDYTFEYVGTRKIAGLDFTSANFRENGIIGGTPRASGSIGNVNIRVTNSAGVSQTYSFTLRILPRYITIVVTAPNNVVYDTFEHDAEVVCYAHNDTERLTPLTGVTPSITYSKYIDGALKKVTAPIDAGVYNINVAAPSGCIATIEGDTSFTIDKGHANISINMQNLNFSYDGKPHAARVRVTPSDVKYIVEYRKHNPDNPEILGEYTGNAPTDIGTYTVRATITDPNYYSMFDIETFAIRAGAGINFELQNPTPTYNGDVQDAQAVPTTDEYTEGYTVTYVDEKGVEVAQPVNAGTYEVKITLNNQNYKIGAIEPHAMTISPKDVDFNILTTDPVVYTGEKLEPEIEAVDYDGDYTVKYFDVKTGAQTDPIKAGTYSIRISITDPNFNAVAPASQRFVIAKKPVSFTLTSATKTYNGEPQSVAVQTDPADFTGYKLMYKNDSTGVERAEAVAAGVYTVLVSITDTNYTVAAGAADATLTINPRVRLSEGNSPAAMGIEEDYYGAIDGINLDGMKSTVIVKNIADFTNNKENVLIIENSATDIKTVFSEPKKASTSGLYTADYPYTLADGTAARPLRRYIMVVGKTGDINGDTYVNATDANSLDGVDITPQTVTQARVWDVNKDGVINSEDGECIRKRFTNPITQFYPWVWK